MQPVTVYSTSYCAFCRQAKELLTRKGITFREIDVTEDDAARAQLTTRTGQRTVPQIFIGETHVGGYTDLAALERQGKLDALLNAR